MCEACEPPVATNHVCRADVASRLGGIGLQAVRRLDGGSVELLDAKGAFGCAESGTRQRVVPPPSFPHDDARTTGSVHHVLDEGDHRAGDVALVHAALLLTRMGWCRVS